MTQKVRVIPSNEVFFDVNEERVFGASSQSEKEKLISPLSQTFKNIVSYFEQESHLLKLVPNETVTREEILNAYKNDVTTTNNAITQFETFIYDTIKCGMEIKGADAEYNERKKYDIAWDMLKNSLPELAKSPLVTLGHERAAKQPAEMLYELQEELSNGIGLMVRRFVYYLHQLVEMDYVGIVEWTATDICRYHYFRHDVSVGAKVLREYSEAMDGTQVGWYEKKREILSHQKVINERNVHTLVDAKAQPLSEFRQSNLPDTIRRYINCIPSWIRQRLEIVTGDLVQVEKIAKIKKEKISINVESVYVYDPAITLGDFALIGYAPKHKPEELLKERKFNWLMAILSVGGTCLLATGIFFFLRYQNIKEQKAHEAYFAFLTQNAGVKMYGNQVTFDTSKVYTVNLYDPITLPKEVGYTRILFGGGYWNQGVGAKPIFRILQADSMYIADSPEIPMRSTIDSTYYGDVQISNDVLGREMPKTVLEMNSYKPIMITVLRTGKNWMTYKITQ